MGFLSKITSAAIKTALTPIAVVKDVVAIATDQPVNNTEKLVESITKDIENSTNEII